MPSWLLCLWRLWDFLCSKSSCEQRSGIFMPMPHCTSNNRTKNTLDEEGNVGLHTTILVQKKKVFVFETSYRGEFWEISKSTRGGCSLELMVLGQISDPDDRRHTVRNVKLRATRLVWSSWGSWLYFCTHSYIKLKQGKTRRSGKYLLSPVFSNK